jgi:hypothetical protein
MLVERFFMPFGSTRTIAASIVFLLAMGNARAIERIPVEVAINGHAFRLGLDTGADVDYAIWSGTAQKLGLAVISPAAATTVPGQVQMGVTEPVKLELPGKTFERQILRVVPSDPGPSPDLDGVVGWPAMRTATLVFNQAEHQLAFGVELPAATEHWTKLRLRDDYGVLAAEIVDPAGGPPGIILIDTGAPDGVELSPEYWAKWKAAHANQRFTQTASYTFGSGLNVAEEAWVEKISLNGLMLRDVPVTRANATSVAAGGRGYLATLGFDQAIAINPDDSTSYRLRGMAEALQRDYSAAMLDFGRAIALLPTDPSAYALRAHAENDQGDHLHAIDDYTQALTKGTGRSPVLYFLRGEAENQQGDRAGAIIDFNDAITLDPNYRDAYEGRASAKAAMGDGKGAELDRAKAHAIQPEIGG